MENHVESSAPTEMSDFARTIYKEKYAMARPDGTSEEWSDTARRVSTHVLAALPQR